MDKIRHRREKNETLAELHDAALEYDLDIQATVEEIVERRYKMYKKRDVGILKPIIPLLDRLIHEAEEYKGWLETKGL